MEQVAKRGGAHSGPSFCWSSKQAEKEEEHKKNMKYDSKSNCENLQKGRNKHIWIINKTESREIKFSTRRTHTHMQKTEIYLTSKRVRVCVCVRVCIEMSADC